ncbi:zinc finger MYM-type protein 1-like [Pistacia vera]|uniref:zinc finger MYM-type protein 1-like n=1 Tax=Pistacia vera TaxID=55513 RepID=UPI001262F9A0|nr:zinc finger MYM-type protein 1-like [Pistacia vera]
MISSFEQEENIGDSSKNVDVDFLRSSYESRQGLTFHGHDESYDSSNQGNFLELLQFLANHNEDYNAVAFKNAPDNLKLTSPKIQKDIVSAASNETVSAIIRDLGDSLFSIMIDESRDISRKEQMTIVLCYVNKNGLVVELFLGVEHVTCTTTLSLKATLYNFFSRHRLSFSRLRGQGYDGASNMQGEFNGLKTLVLKENRCAYYIHCFAHQLQLAFVALAKNHDDVNDLFNIVVIVVNIVNVSSKHCNLLRDKQACKVIETLSNGELSSGKGLNQEINMQRASDTRWGSHYGTLMSIILMFPSIIDVLEIVAKDRSNSKQRFHAKNIFKLMQSFDFVFSC